MIGDRDLAERYLDRADNGFTPHVTSPWRWQSHILDLWEQGDDELVGRPWDDLALDALRAALDDLADRFGPDPDGWRWGRVHEMEFPHPLGAANPLLRRLLNRRLPTGGAQETVSQIAYDPNVPFRAVWAPSWRMVADPADPDGSRWQMFTGQSGHPASTHYDDLQQDWLEGRTQPMAGEGALGGIDPTASGPRRTRSKLRGRQSLVSRRDQIQLSEAEQRELIEAERVVVVGSFGPRGWPHLMPLWYVPRDGEIWIWTYAKSQKVRNLERDPRATLLIETGHEYGDLRGLMIEAEAEIHRDVEVIAGFAEQLTVRYAEGIEAVEGDAAAALKAQAQSGSRSASRLARSATWDHRKLGGRY